MKLATTVEAHAVNAVVEPATVRIPVAEAAGALVNIAAAQRRHRPVCVLGVLSDDVDDPIDRIRSPNGAAGPPDHLNALDVFERSRLGLPIDACEQRGVNAPSVDQYEQFAG